MNPRRTVFSLLAIPAVTFALTACIVTGGPSSNQSSAPQGEPPAAASGDCSGLLAVDGARPVDDSSAALGFELPDDPQCGNVVSLGDGESDIYSWVYFDGDASRIQRIVDAATAAGWQPGGVTSTGASLSTVDNSLMDMLVLPAGSPPLNASGQVLVVTAQIRDN